MAKWRSYFSMLLTSISLAVAAIPKPCLHLLPLHLPGAKRLAKVMHLYENSGGGNTWISYLYLH
jgi:hypothetical protein